MRQRVGDGMSGESAMHQRHGVGVLFRQPLLERDGICLSHQLQLQGWERRLSRDGWGDYTLEWDGVRIQVSQGKQVDDGRMPTSSLRQVACSG